MTRRPPKGVRKKGQSPFREQDSDPFSLHLYCAETDNIGADCDVLFARDDLARSAGMAPRRRAEFMSGRALLRFALERWTGRPADTRRLHIAPGGKPEYRGGPAFSISHHGGLVVCAVAPGGGVGVDVQCRVPRRRIDAIARQYFSAEESAWLEAQADDRFYMLWVLKEAYLKAVGSGLTGGLNRLQCRINPPAIEATIAGDSPAAVQLSLYSWGAAFLAVATVDCPFSTVRIERWSPGAPSSSIRLIAATARPRVD